MNVKYVINKCDFVLWMLLVFLQRILDGDGVGALSDHFGVSLDICIDKDDDDVSASNESDDDDDISPNDANNDSSSEEEDDDKWD